MALHAMSTLAKSHIEFVLGTINAPRPRPIDAKTIVRCLTSSRPTRAGVHISKRSSTKSRRNLVLVGVVTFEDFCRAARMESHRWQKRPLVRKMADLQLTRTAA